MSSKTIAVHLPDGAIREVLSGTTPLEIANAISPRLAAASVVARVTPLAASTAQAAGAQPDGAEAAMYAAESATGPRLVDLSAPLTEDTRLELVTEKDPEALKVVRHSAAHVLATAVLELFPETKLGHGPATDQGFFYDFYRPTPFTPDDLAAIEAKMKEVIARDEPFARIHESREKALAEFERDGDFMKTHFVTKFTEPGSDVSFYRNGNFVDFCRGPHVPSTGRVKAFKVLSLAGAYWLGDEKNPQLQRVYGTAFFSQKDLDAHFARLEEAAKRDHRLLGKQLDLFSIQELAGPGLVFWHPKGAMVRKVMEDWMKDECLRLRGYLLVNTPHVARVDLWQTSGHEGFYSQNMFTPMELDDANYRMKPMELPIPCADLQELAEELSRSAAALCRAGQWSTGATSALAPCTGCCACADLRKTMLTSSACQARLRTKSSPASISPKTCSKLSVLMSSRSSSPPGIRTIVLTTLAAMKTGRSQRALLKRALERKGIAYKTIPGEAAFYGPKIDIKLVDVLGRLWQLSTVQFDFTLPARFELEYVGEDGERHQPVMVHRALFGSVERFFGVLIEHYAGAFPLWLAPVQVGLVPISERHHAYAKKVESELKAAGLRVEVDDRNEKMNAKIRDFANQKVPYILVFGDKEEAAGSVSVRTRAKGDQGSVPLADFVAKCKELVAGQSMEL